MQSHGIILKKNCIYNKRGYEMTVCPIRMGFVK